MRSALISSPVIVESIGPSVAMAKSIIGERSYRITLMERKHIVVDDLGSVAMPDSIAVVFGDSRADPVPVVSRGPVI